MGTTEGKTYDVIFIGTTRGRVIKAINAQSADSRQNVDTIVIEELQVFFKSFPESNHFKIPELQLLCTTDSPP